MLAPNKKCSLNFTHAWVFIFFLKVFLVKKQVYNNNVDYYYYIGTSVLLENMPLVKFIKTTSGARVVVFHNLTREFIDEVISVISLYYFFDVFLSI